MDTQVVIDLLGNFIDRANNVFGKGIAGGGFGAENKYAGTHFVVGIVKQAAVEREDMQQIEVLTLVFVQTFDLHVEECIGIDLDAAVFPHKVSKGLLIGTLDRHEAFLKVRVVSKIRKFCETIEIFWPIVAKLLGNEIGEARITGEKPAPRCNPVGHVDQLVGIQLMAREEMLLEKVRV